MSPKEKQKFVDYLRLISQHNDEISRNLNFLDKTPNRPANFRTKNKLK